MNAKPFFVLIFFAFLITTFAGGAIGETDLTPDTPAAINNNEFAANSLAPVNFGASGGVCPVAYSVRSGDTLSAIARTCSVALADLLAVNPQITNANLINVGQVIRIPVVAAPVAQQAAVQQPAAEEQPAAVEDVVFPTPEPTATQAPVEPAAPVVDEPAPTNDAIFAAFETARSPEEGGQPAVRIATPRPTIVAKGLKPGSLVQVSVAGFPANVPVSVGIGQLGKEPFFIDESVTDDQGIATVVVAIPAGAVAGQKWTVTIVTVSSDPPVTATAVPFTIGK